MGLRHAYVAPFAATIKARIDKPVLVTGRINQPQVAEQVIASGQADLCGMTRALICDPAMPAKVAAGRLDDIRACIACNQSCIGRSHKGLPISCLQYPESGREREFGNLAAAHSPRRIMVVGAGPGGMKAAAAVAAARGHAVTLYEKQARIGGQVPAGAKPAGARGVWRPCHQPFPRDDASRCHPGDRARGERRDDRRGGPRRGDPGDRRAALFTGRPGARGSPMAVTAWDLLRDQANVGASVVIADWRCDWIGIGLAEKLASAGCRVRLCVNGAMAGESLQLYVRNHYVGAAAQAGRRESKPTCACLAPMPGAAYFQDTLSDQPVVLDEVDTVVLSLGHVARERLGRGACEKRPPSDCHRRLQGAAQRRGSGL